MKVFKQAIAPWLGVLAALTVMGFVGWIEGGMQ